MPPAPQVLWQPHPRDRCRCRPTRPLPRRPLPVSPTTTTTLLLAWLQQDGFTPLTLSHPPRSTVLEENLEAHVSKCPLKKQAAALAAQPYYSEGVNSGGGETGRGVTSAEKRAIIYKLTEEEFRGLLGKIRSAHEAAAVAMRESYLITDACDKWMNGQVDRWHDFVRVYRRGVILNSDGVFDRKVPYQEKHVAQQASIVGNMEAFGLLRRGDAEAVDGDDALVGAQAVVEFGAGRGYLTQVLVDCYGIRNVFLVERRAYKLKISTDKKHKYDAVEDLKLHGVEELSGLKYLAIGKHLCGPATDMTMTCCLHEQCDLTDKNHDDKHHLQGLALATCCHHLCQWKHYTNKSFLSRLGITEDEFHAMTWLSSWAVDGDHSSQDSSVEVEDTSCEIREPEKPDAEAVGIERIIRTMPAGERATLGFKCKDIIDTGARQRINSSTSKWANGMEGYNSTNLEANIARLHTIVYYRAHTARHTKDNMAFAEMLINLLLDQIQKSNHLDRLPSYGNVQQIL
ncbi:hypothetical protein EJB05_03737, partial [Eragrostis curvula]